MKCEECDFVTDRKGLLKKHVNAKHTMKKYNECEFTTLSQCEMKKHKDKQHEPDNFKEKSAFNKLLYHKVWSLRGVHDPLSALQAYKQKIRNSLGDYINEKGAAKWYIGMKVIMGKHDKDGNNYQQVVPGFSSNTTISLTTIDFNELYEECTNKIINDFVEFNANGSGWILNRVSHISIHMYNYQPIV